MNYAPRTPVPGVRVREPVTAFGADSSAASGTAARVTVWDLGVRLFHWLLVAAVVAALGTGFFSPKNWLDAHIVFGTAVAALIVFRLVWGFAGSTHARFASFLTGPRTALRYLKSLLTGRAGHHIGHNPLGAMMIVALLLVLGLLTATGLAALGGAVKQGPLAAVTNYATGRSAKGVHEALAFGLLGLIALHVAGVAIESLRVRENLAQAMLTGRKAIASARAAAIKPGRPRLATVVLALIALTAVPSLVYTARLPGLGVPNTPVDTTYAKECSACHTIYHPSLAPADTWRAVMAGLNDHFGDNASLDETVSDRLLAYLTENSAEHWDTKAANRFRIASGTEPLRITATQAWTRIHRKIPQTAFNAKAVGGKVNCAACHGDAASGRFAPQAIAIPKEKTAP